jgi:hypothetical protein
MDKRIPRAASLCAVAVGLTASVVLASASEDTGAPAVPLKLESVLGRDVSTAPDGDAGRIIDLLVDRDGTVRAAVVEFGGFLGIGTRKIAIEWQAFRFSGRAISVEVTRDQVRAAPEYKSKERPPLVKAITE